MFLKVRINDPLRLLPQGVDGPLTPRKLLVGVMYANGAYQGAGNISADSAGRDYRLVIPAGTPFKLWLFSRDIALADAKGNAIGTSGAQTSFQAEAGQDQVFTFTVTGPSVSFVNYDIDGQPDPTLTVVRGQTYNFTLVNCGIHPFRIQSTQGFGGTLCAESQEGKGTRMIVRLPVVTSGEAIAVDSASPLKLAGIHFGGAKHGS